MKYTLIPIVLSVAIFPQVAHAARVYFEPAATTIAVGESFTANVIVDTEQASINAIDLAIQYPPLLTVQSISRTGSAIQLWVHDPSFTRQAINLSGGIPGGATGNHLLVARVVLRATAVGIGGLGIDTGSQVLLNDGLGTAATLHSGSAGVTVVPRPPGKSASPAPSPTPEEKTDTQAPKPFPIEVGNDPSVFHGGTFVSFYTSDQGSGVDRYELREGNGPYGIAQSPFLLSDQKLHTVITVRAYDHDGNVREVVWPGFFTRAWWWIIRHFGWK